MYIEWDTDEWGLTHLEVSQYLYSNFKNVVLTLNATINDNLITLIDIWYIEIECDLNRVNN